MLEIETGAEIRACAPEHDEAGVAVALQALEIDVEGVDQRRIERVEAFRAIERHPVEAVLVLNQQRLSHACHSSHRRPGQARREPGPITTGRCYLALTSTT